VSGWFRDRHSPAAAAHVIRHEGRTMTACGRVLRDPAPAGRPRSDQPAGRACRHCLHMVEVGLVDRPCS
jgi:hypothetical protein